MLDLVIVEIIRSPDLRHTKETHCRRNEQCLSLSVCRRTVEEGRRARIVPTADILRMSYQQQTEQAAPRVCVCVGRGAEAYTSI